MTHRFPIKEIARQAALSTATVDRALNRRAHVSPQARARVNAAIQELEAQENQLIARGRQLFFDFIIEAPGRFSREVKMAAEDVLPQIAAAVCRPRFLMQEVMQEDEVLAAVSRIIKKGSSGVCLKARDTPKIREAINRLSQAQIPVVTLVTDIIKSDRIAYAGLNNASAGRTAAYLIAKTAGKSLGQVLATRSHEHFVGEEARETAFIDALLGWCPKLQVISVKGGSGIHYETSGVLASAIKNITNLRAVYSMGGGNRSILDVLHHNGLLPEIFVAHDFDQENQDLIVNGKLDFILHHDLRIDLKQVFNAFLSYHRLASDFSSTSTTDVQIITPENVPLFHKSKKI